MKRNRHGRILKIIAESPIKTQEQLTDALRKEGFAVTQATVSRDIKELGLLKVSSKDGGYRYAQEKARNDRELNMFSKTIVSIESALHTVVIKTYAGMAQAVAASLDAMSDSEILGSIAGDDTILLITRGEREATMLVPKLEKLFKNI